MRRTKMVFSKLMEENKEEILRSKDTLNRIEEKVDARIQKRNTFKAAR